MTVAQNRIRNWGASNYIPYKGKMVTKPKNLTDITQYMSRDDMLLYITEAFNREFFTEYIPDLVGANLVQTMTVNSPMISYMFESGFDAFPLGEGVEIPIAKPKYGKVTIRVQKFGVGVSITNEAIEDVQSFDVVARQVKNGMDACARFEDKMIMQTLINGVSDGSSNFKTGQFVSGFAYLISKKIKREGINSLAFFQKPLGLGLKQFGPKLGESFVNDVIDGVKNAKVKNVKVTITKT